MFYFAATSPRQLAWGTAFTTQGVRLGILKLKSQLLLGVVDKWRSGPLNRSRRWCSPAREGRGEEEEEEGRFVSHTDAK